MTIIRWIFAVYCTGLTVLLVVPDPWASLGLTFLQGEGSGRGIHFTCFTFLALLLFACRFREPPALLFTMLLGYAVAVEILQLWVPNRTVELIDIAENAMGLLLGAGVWWCWNRAVRRKRIP